MQSGRVPKAARTFCCYGGNYSTENSSGRDLLWPNAVELCPAAWGANARFERQRDRSFTYRGGCGRNENREYRMEARYNTAHRQHCPVLVGGGN
jgi:hypothetical protein